MLFPLLFPFLRLRFVPVLFAALTFSSCVTPPEVVSSQVLPNREVKLVGYIKRGKDYANAGRFELAEVEFRKALRIEKNLSSLHNDLGYALQAQDRQEEAAASFRRAIELDPKNLAARENLARILYLQDDLDGGIREYETLLGVYQGMTKAEIKTALGKDYSPADFAQLYRSLATTYYRAGQYDEALCYSEKTLTGPVNFTQVGQHARLMLSLGMSQRAAAYLHDVISVWQGGTPGKLFIDYGIALIDTGDRTLARESLSRAQSAKDIEEGDRRDIPLLLALAGAEDARASLGEEGAEDPEYCRRAEVDRFKYWPLKVIKEAQTLLKQWCHDQKQLVVSG